jgi:hypothetical protein
VRRALAAAARKAVEVDAFVLLSWRAADDDTARRLARRALGPAGASVPLLVVIGRPEAAEGDPAPEPWPGSKVLSEIETLLQDPWRLAVAVAISPDRCVTLCLGRS